MSKINREIAILLRIRNRSPYVPTITDFGLERMSETLFIVTEDFGGVTLTDYLSINYTIQDVKGIIRCLIRGVLAAHEAGVFHRDIKPGNVIINNQGKARLIDWGHATFYKLGESLNVRVSTKPYKPPELLVEFAQYDMKVDTWGLGNVLGCLVS